MPTPLSENDRDKLRKVLSVMRSATIEGERKAAEVAATRIAEAHGMSLEEASLEAFPEEDDGTLSHDEKTAQRRAAQAWAANKMRMTNAAERAEKYRFMMAKEAARQRGLQEERVKPHRVAPSNARTYIPGKEDEFRLIAGLLRDGVPLARTAEITGASTVDVARVWLLMRAA